MTSQQGLAELQWIAGCSGHRTTAARTRGDQHQAGQQHLPAYRCMLLHGAARSARSLCWTRQPQISGPGCTRLPGAMPVSRSASRSHLRLSGRNSFIHKMELGCAYGCWLDTQRPAAAGDADFLRRQVRLPLLFFFGEARQRLLCSFDPIALAPLLTSSMKPWCCLAWLLGRAGQPVLPPRGRYLGWGRINTTTALPLHATYLDSRSGLHASQSLTPHYFGVGPRLYLAPPHLPCSLIQQNQWPVRNTYWNFGQPVGSRGNLFPGRWNGSSCRQPVGWISAAKLSDPPLALLRHSPLAVRCRHGVPGWQQATRQIT